MQYKLLSLLAIGLLLLMVSCSSTEKTTFTVTIENISTSNTLTLPDNSTIAVPLAPGVWVVHKSTEKPLFTSGAKDNGEGLEALAEDGIASTLGNSVDGKFKSSGVFDTPMGKNDAGAIGPGEKYEFEVTAEPGDHLSFATMFVQSNDLFYAPADNGIALFNGDTAKTGDLSGILLWDSGTEENETPGVGENQAPRQGDPNTGPADPDDTVREATGNERPNTTGGVIKVSLTPKS